MKTISVGICDDEDFFLESLYALVSACGNENKMDLTIRKYTESETLLIDIDINKYQPDLLFLDIDMPGASGMEVADRLRKDGYDGIICFVTSHDSYALDAYGVEALGYLLKPAQYTDVKKLMEKAVIQILYKQDTKEAEKRFLEINTQRGKALIPVEQILYLEKRRNQCVIHRESGEIVCYEPLKSLYPRLDQSLFCYTHQGFIVNFEKIKEVAEGTAFLGEGVEVPISRRYQKTLKERHMDKIYRIRDERRTRSE